MINKTNKHKGCLQQEVGLLKEESTRKVDLDPSLEPYPTTTALNMVKFNTSNQFIEEGGENQEQQQ